MTIAKGATLRTTLDYLGRELGLETHERVLQRLDPQRRRQVEEAASTDEVPYELALALWHAADDVLSREHPTWIERSGAYSIESAGVQLYGGILRKASPLEFLTQRVSLFRLYYHPGDMEVIANEPGHAVLRLVDFPQSDPLFCRRQTGGLHRALELAGGDSPHVRHVRCVADGDAFCEWELGWK